MIKNSRFPSRFNKFTSHSLIMLLVEAKADLWIMEKNYGFVVNTFVFSAIFAESTFK